MRLLHVLLFFAVALAAVLQSAPAHEIAHAADLSGNGKLLVRDNPPGFRLASVEPDGSDFRILTAGTNGSWSPDGRKIAFDTEYTTSDISMMDADGSDVTPVFVGASVDILPTWSPDGERIAFASGRDGQGVGIYTARADGTDVVQLTDWNTIRVEGNDPPKWSPDGSKILFIGQEPATGSGSTWDLYTVPAAGGGFTRLTNTQNKEFTPEWSPDGTKIAFVDSFELGIMVMNSGGGAATKIATAAGIAFTQGTGPVWSPDGERIAYSEMTSLPGIPPVTFASYVMDVNGGNKQAIPVPGIILDWQPVPATKVEFTQGIQVLQSIGKLQEDLKGDGQPPVPLVAGKPAAMRVYFDEVDQPTTYFVDSNLDSFAPQEVRLFPGCTVKDRRAWKNNCSSVDFYFLPPQGQWTADLIIKDPGGNVVEQHEFDFNTPKVNPLVLPVVDICDDVQGGVWECGDTGLAPGLVQFLSNIAPTHDVHVVQTGHEVKRDFTGGDPKLWWAAATQDLLTVMGAHPADFVALGEARVAYGPVRPSGPGGNLGRGAGIGNFAFAAKTFTETLGVEDSQETLAHEAGHALGLRHTNTGAPAAASRPGCYGTASAPTTGWPYADNMLRSGPAPGEIEVGFDVVSGQPLPGDDNFEIMGYCGPQWVSPRSAIEMYNALRGSAPAAPLAAARAGAQGFEAGEFWLVAGAIEGGAAGLRPLLAMQTEGPAGPGEGTHRIEVRGAGDAVLFTRNFEPAASASKIEPGGEDSEGPPFFAELVPVQAGAQSVVIIGAGDAQLGQVALAGAAPSVEIGLPASFSGTQTLSWSITDADSSSHTSWVEYSADGGTTWDTLATYLADNSLAVDFDALPGSTDARFRVIASDGVNSGADESGPFTVAGKLPEGAIIAPAGGSYRLGRLVWLQASALDADDGFLDGASVQWSSSRDGSLGTGASLPVFDLPAGTHTITMTARDGDANTVTDSITVTVFGGPIIEGQAAVSGDVDCSGAVNSIDALKLSRSIAGLPVVQTEPCPDIGTGDGDVFGDVNCDAHITAVDTLLVLRFVAALAMNVPQGCRPVGT